MSLRDWFAGQVLTGLMQYDWPDVEYGMQAYKIADAMLKEREKEK